MTFDDKVVNRYLNNDQHIKALPKKYKPRQEVLKYLVTFFESKKSYTEKEVNNIIFEHHTFNDITMLRRELINSQLMKRTTDGSKYWLSEL